MVRAARSSVFLFVLADLAAAGGPQAPRADNHSAMDRQVRAAFVKAWKAQSAPPAERAKAATELYRHAWLRPLCYPVSYVHTVLRSPRIVPQGTKAEDIPAGKFGKVEPPQLWSLTNRICIDLFLEQHPTIIALIAADIKGSEEVARRAQLLIYHMRSHLYLQSARRRADGTGGLDERAQRTLKAMQEALFPVLKESFLAAREKNDAAADLLARGLRDLDDPRAIPVLLGDTPERHIKREYERLRSLQRRRRAHAGLIALLSHGDKEARWRAAFALAESGDAALAPHLLKLLRDPAPEVRKQALHVAHFLPARREGELYEARTALLRDERRDVRLACARLFAEQRDRVCAQTLLELLRDPTLDQEAHCNVVGAVQTLTHSYFGYHFGSAGWQPTTEHNRAAIARFERWINDGPALVMRLSGARAHYQADEQATIDVFIRNRRNSPIQFFLKRPLRALHLVVTSPRGTTFGYDPFPTRRIAGPRAQDYGEIAANTEVKLLSFSFVAGQRSPRWGAWVRRTGDPKSPLPFLEKGRYGIAFRCKHFAVPRARSHYPTPEARCEFTIGEAGGRKQAPRSRPRP